MEEKKNEGKLSETIRGRGHQRTVFLFSSLSEKFFSYATGKKVLSRRFIEGDEKGNHSNSNTCCTGFLGRRTQRYFHFVPPSQLY